MCTLSKLTLLHTGAEFEKRILANEKNNVKFNFLVPTDPYHAYYRMRVSLCLMRHPLFAAAVSAPAPYALSLLVISIWRVRAQG